MRVSLDLTRNRTMKGLPLTAIVTWVLSQYYISVSLLPRDASLEIVIVPWRKRVCVQANPEALSVAFDHSPVKKIAGC